MAVEARGLRDALREAEVAGTGRAIPATEHQLCAIGQDRAKDERHRIRTEDGRRPDAATATLQAGSSLASAGLNSGARRAVEMTGPWKAWKSRSSFSTLPPSLGNLANTARFPHSHSPASSQLGNWKTNGRFPTFPTGTRDADYPRLPIRQPRTGRFPPWWMAWSVCRCCRAFPYWSLFEPKT